MSAKEGKVSEGEKSRANTDPLELWRQWYDMSLGAWANLLGGNEETYGDPYGLYRSWFDNLRNVREKLEESPAETTNPYGTWWQWTEATIETWRRAAEIGTRMTGLIAPRWMEMVGEAQKQILDGGNLPTDPLDFYTRLYNAASGPLTKMTDDLLRDEAFLEISKRSLDYYAIFDSIFRRASEEYFSNLQLPTTSDMTQTAGLIVALDDKVDRIEEVLEDFEHGYKATAETIDTLEERLDRVERRLDQLDRVESKLDQLLAARGTSSDGGAQTEASRSAPQEESGSST